MHQRGQMDHFDDHGHRQMRFVEGADGFAAEGDEDGAELFALGGEGVAREGGDLRFELGGLSLELAGHALQKRFHPLRNLFPAQGLRRR